MPSALNSGPLAMISATMRPAASLVSPEPAMTARAAARETTVATAERCPSGTLPNGSASFLPSAAVPNTVDAPALTSSWSALGTLARGTERRNSSSARDTFCCSCLIWSALDWMVWRLAARARMPSPDAMSACWSTLSIWRFAAVSTAAVRCWSAAVRRCWSACSRRSPSLRRGGAGARGERSEG